MKKKILLFSLTSLMAIPLFSCSNEQAESGWGIKEADYQNILKFDNEVSQKDDKLEFKVDDEFGSFKGKIDSDNVILFNLDKLHEIKGKKYYTYEDFKSCEVEKASFISSDIGRGFTITFNGNPNSRYGTITNKDAMIDNEYAFSIMENPINKVKRLAQEEGEWEDAYIETKAESEGIDWTPAIQIEHYVVKMVAGYIFANPLSIVDGGYGLLAMIGGMFAPAEPSIADVLEKLGEIDKKLDDLTEEIKKNQRELIDEEIYTQAQIDKALVALYQQDYTDYVTHYLDPVDTIERDYSQYIDAKLKQLVKSEPETITLKYKRNEENKLVQLSQSEEHYDDFGIKTLQVKAKSYGNAQSYLTLHNNVIGEGFMEELNKDIDELVNDEYGKSLPTEQFSKEDYRRQIISTILDNFSKERYTGEYGTDEYAKASNMLDKAILLLRRISGVSTGESIISSIMKRMQSMYNFAYESKPKVKALLANMKFTIERYLLMTVTACRYAKINMSNLVTEYDRAIETIQAYYKANKDLPDSYCHITNTVIESGFIWSKYTAEFKNRGEHPQFKKEFIAEKINTFNRWTGKMDRTRLDLSKTAIIKPNDQRKIFKRFTLLVQAGLESEVDYLKYLANNKGIEENGYKIQQTMINDKWMTDDTSRILSEYEGIKQLTEKDDFNFTCVENGNSEGGNYFKVGNKYKFKGTHEAEYWSGEKATALFIDAHNGTDRASHIISAYAKYSEEYFLWADNEHWAFSSNPGGSYFYLMYSAPAK